MKNLKILLFFRIVLVFLFLIFLLRFYNIDNDFSEQAINDYFLVLDYKIDGDLLELTLNNKEKYKAFYYIKNENELDYFKNALFDGVVIYAEGDTSKPIDNTIPNTFNYKNFLLSNNIKAVFNIEEFKITEENVSILFRIKKFLLLNTNDYVGSYKSALIFGNTDSIEFGTYLNYQTLGISHLLAISGMHVGILSAILLKILSFLRVKKREFFLLLFLIFYLFITSFSPSILRAILFMFMLKVFKHLRISKKEILLLTGLIILVIAPNLILNLGFQYSFITTYFLLGLKNNELKISNIFNMSFIAFIAGLPLTIYYFYEINVMSLFYNMLLVPYVSLVLYPLTLLSYILPVLDWMLYLVIVVFEKITSLFVLIDSVIVVPKVSYIYILVYYAFLSGIKDFNIKYVLLPIFLVSFAWMSVKLDKSGYVYFIDVGQGDSTLVVSPYMKDVTLIDTGGRIEYEKEEWQIRDTISLAEKMLTFFKSIGIVSIDNLILTHGDYDHIGEALEIKEKMTVNNVVLNSNEYNGIEQEFLGFSSNYQYENMSFTQLSYLEKEDENDSSIVNLFKIYDTHFLLMGDVSAEVETELIDRYYSLEVDILKLGHHGSSSSSSDSFILTLKPEIAIISAGRNNRYGHPHQKVLDILNNNKVDYLLTSEVGTIKFKVTEKGFTQF